MPPSSSDSVVLMTEEEYEDKGQEGGLEVEGNDSESLHDQIATALVNALIGHGHVPLIATHALSALFHFTGANAGIYPSGVNQTANTDFGPALEMSLGLYDNGSEDFHMDEIELGATAKAAANRDMDVEQIVIGKYGCHALLRCDSWKSVIVHIAEQHPNRAAIHTMCLAIMTRVLYVCGNLIDENNAGTNNNAQQTEALINDHNTRLANALHLQTQSNVVAPSVAFPNTNCRH